MHAFSKNQKWQPMFILWQSMTKVLHCRKYREMGRGHQRKGQSDSPCRRRQKGDQLYYQGKRTHCINYRTGNSDFYLYAMGYKSEQKSQPFIHQLDINTGIGGPIQVWASFNNGALANVMSIAKFNTIKHRLGYYRPSSHWLCMADGSLLKPKARWEGKIEIE